MICFDEGQQLTEDNVFYALSRLRSTRVPYPRQAVITCNPDPDSFLFNFVKFSLDDNLIPIRRESYDKRFFCRTPSGILWYNTLEEAQEVHGTDEDSGVKSFLYIPGCIYDNPIGLEQNKDYIATLKALPDVERRRLLEGAWVRAQFSGFFKREWAKMVYTHNSTTRNRVRAWDLAATLPSEVNPDPDWTVGSLVSKTSNGEYTIEHVARIRDRTHKVEEFIFNTALMDGEDVTICLPLDPGASGMAYTRDLQRRLSERGFSVMTKRPDKSKMIRFKPFASIAEAGFLSVVKADWNDMLFNELEAFDGTGRIHDDSVDSLSDSVWALNRTIQLPDFVLPDLSQGNSLADINRF
jgi:predicted phage terminase large subunit-like protein